MHYRYGGQQHQQLTTTTSLLTSWSVRRSCDWLNFDFTRLLSRLPNISTSLVETSWDSTTPALTLSVGRRCHVQASASTIASWRGPVVNLWLLEISSASRVLQRVPMPADSIRSLPYSVIFFGFISLHLSVNGCAYHSQSITVEICHSAARLNCESYVFSYII